jgi:hypothetical protein
MIFSPASVLEIQSALSSPRRSKSWHAHGGPNPPWKHGFPGGKKDFGLNGDNRSRHELIGVFKNGKAPHRNNVELGRYGRNRSNVWPYPGATGFGRRNEEGVLLRLHPTVKPVALVADAILDCSSRGHLVLDAFLGSGTTLIAAERTGRTCYGIELDPLYVDTIIRRWQAYAGEIARHHMSGQSLAELAEERGGRHDENLL